MSSSDNMYQDKRDDAQIERTINLSERDVRAAARVLGVLTGLEAGLSRGVEADQPRASDEDREECRARARQHLHSRRSRAELFGKSMFGEPAWDMLVVLYVNDAFGPRQTIGTLAALSGAPKATAVRWIQYLEGHNLIDRESHPVDRRTAFVSLSEKARALLDAYFSGTATR